MLARRGLFGLAVFGLALLGQLSSAQPARAEGGVDADYGRIDDDVSAAAAVGTTVGPRGPRAAVDMRFRYLWTAGLFVTYEDGPLFGSDAEPRRAFASGVELRPLFFARWLQGKEIGNSYLDMTIDSLGLELGAIFLQPSGASFGSKPGLQASLGVVLPILPRISGPVIGIHAGGRWSNGALAGRAIEDASDRSLFCLLTVGWQQGFGAHLVDFGDRAP
jgi:hypothetical protein